MLQGHQIPTTIILECTGLDAPGYILTADRFAPTVHGLVGLAYHTIFLIGSI